MKRNLKKTIGAVFACTLMLTSAIGADITASALNTVAVTDTRTYSVKSKETLTYFFDTDPRNMFIIDLYFMNGSDIPYFEINDVVDLIETVKGDNYVLKVGKRGDIVKLTRETGHTLSIDVKNDTFTFSDYDRFINIYEKQIEDTGFMQKDENGQYLYLKQLSSSIERSGKKVVMDAGAYGIDIVRDGDKYYIPVQTVSDIFLAGDYFFLYNGRALFLIDPATAEFADEDGLTGLGKKYYGKDFKYATGKVSKTLAEFSYKEFCFTLDQFYGLKGSHHIESFGELTEQLGYKKMFTGTNAKKIEYAIYNTIDIYLNDPHSITFIPSYLSGKDGFRDIIRKSGIGRKQERMNELDDEYSDLRNKYYPDGIPAYEEIGDTAFITFDEFIDNSYTEDYYSSAPTEDAEDTTGIIAYSIQRILRKNSPIKNVVLDLTCNVGGENYAAAYTIAAFLGKASTTYESTLSGAIATYEYKADTNFDGKFNSADTLAGKGLNLYCLESDLSYSCANKVPSAFKKNGSVTLIGRKSAGGSCTVSFFSTATGSVLTISGHRHELIEINGSYYDPDGGVEPDIYISKTENLFNRKELVKYIDSLI